MTDTTGFKKLRSNPPCHEPPWFQIGKRYSQGWSVVRLLKAYPQLKEAELRKYLATHCTTGGKVRTNLEVIQASNQVRDDLVSSLLNASAMLKAKEAFNRDEIAALEKLTATAQKLFQWPAARPVESANALPSEAGAINLNLLRLSPEQIRNAGDS
jgi:hypothetical protein